MAGPTRVIATLPPYVDHRALIIQHPRVDGLRFNTISPLAERREEVLARLARETGEKPLWIDLKGRQLRITRFAYLPYAYVELSRRIRVDLPVDVHFRDCVSRAVENVGGSKLILNRRPVRVVGEGEPINILDPSLEIEGYLTESDREYVEAARALDLHDYMLSFVEGDADLAELESLDPDASIVAKIESLRGLDYVRRGGSKRVRLMAARDDLFVHLADRPAEWVKALESVVRADPDAFVASRILGSLEESPNVSSADLADLELMRRLGFRVFVLDDTLCFREESFRAAIDVLVAVLGS